PTVRPRQSPSAARTAASYGSRGILKSQYRPQSSDSFDSRVLRSRNLCFFKLPSLAMQT
ncbi:hypothetical protein TNCV_5046811, partial [Trichonephila clavipes]